MKRYYSDDPEQPDDFFQEENKFDGNDEDEEAMQQIIMEEQGVDIVATQLNIMATSIHFLAQSFFWKFKSHKTRLKELEETFGTFSRIMFPAYTPEEKEKNDANL